MTSTAWTQLGAYLRETQLLGSVQSTLYWDQNTRMPSAGAPWRGEQLAMLATQLHARQSAEPYADLIRQARQDSLDEVTPSVASARCRNLDLLEDDLRRHPYLQEDQRS